jgi:hypothetical protein
MQLVRTTIRLKEQLKKSAERKAFEEDMSFQDIMSRALEKYLEEEGRKEAKKIVFKTHHLGERLDNLTRDDYYSDPQEGSVSK